MSLYDYDRAVCAAFAAGEAAPLCGIDEAGRGPLAGPVYAAAVILPPGAEISGLNDSKKLTAQKRALLYERIVQQATAHCIASASHEEIDALNILQATLLAMRRAVQGLGVLPGLLLVDGNSDPCAGPPTRLVVQGDAHSACIAAASILAKVARDRHMAELDSAYPQWRFAQHKGYGTKLHYEMLNAHGPSPVHRNSFLKKWQAAGRNPVEID